MFRPVVITLFRLMEQHESAWRYVHGSEDVPVCGVPIPAYPRPFDLYVGKTIDELRTGYFHFNELGCQFIHPDNFTFIEAIIKQSVQNFHFSVEIWVKILYDLACTFHH